MSDCVYTLAELAPDLDEAAVAVWHAAPGARIDAGDDLLDLVTDKACITLPAPASGRVVRQHAAPDAVVRAADALVTLDQD